LSDWIFRFDPCRSIPDNSGLKFGTMLLKGEPIEPQSAIFPADQTPTMILKKIVLSDWIFRFDPCMSIPDNSGLKFGTILLKGEPIEPQSAIFLSDQTPTMILKKIVLSDWIFRFDPCRSIPDNSGVKFGTILLKGEKIEPQSAIFLSDQTPTMILKKIVLSDWIFRFDPCRSIPDNSGLKFGTMLLKGEPIEPQSAIFLSDQTPTMILKKIVLSDWIFRFDPCRSIPDNSGVKFGTILLKGEKIEPQSAIFLSDQTPTMILKKIVLSDWIFRFDPCRSIPDNSGLKFGTMLLKGEPIEPQSAIFPADQTPTMILKKIVLSDWIFRFDPCMSIPDNSGLKFGTILLKGEPIEPQSAIFLSDQTPTMILKKIVLSDWIFRFDPCRSIPDNSGVKFGTILLKGEKIEPQSAIFLSDQTPTMILKKIVLSDWIFRFDPCRSIPDNSGLKFGTMLLKGEPIEPQSAIFLSDQTPTMILKKIVLSDWIFRFDPCRSIPDNSGVKFGTILLKGEKIEPQSAIFLSDQTPTMILKKIVLSDWIFRFDPCRSIPDNSGLKFGTMLLKGEPIEPQSAIFLSDQTPTMILKKIVLSDWIFRFDPCRSIPDNSGVKFGTILLKGEKIEPQSAIFLSDQTPTMILKKIVLSDWIFRFDPCRSIPDNSGVKFGTILLKGEKIEPQSAIFLSDQTPTMILKKIVLSDWIFRFDPCRSIPDNSGLKFGTMLLKGEPIEPQSAIFLSDQTPTMILKKIVLSDWIFRFDPCRSIPDNSGVKFGTILLKGEKIEPQSAIFLSDQTPTMILKKIVLSDWIFRFDPCRSIPDNSGLKFGTMLLKGEPIEPQSAIFLSDQTPTMILKKIVLSDWIFRFDPCRSIPDNSGVKFGTILLKGEKIEPQSAIFLSDQTPTMILKKIVLSDWIFRFDPCRSIPDNSGLKFGTMLLKGEKIEPQCAIFLSDQTPTIILKKIVLSDWIFRFDPCMSIPDNSGLKFGTMLLKGKPIEPQNAIFLSDQTPTMILKKIVLSDWIFRFDPCRSIPDNSGLKFGTMLLKGEPIEPQSAIFNSDQTPTMILKKIVLSDWIFRFDPCRSIPDNSGLKFGTMLLKGEKIEPQSAIFHSDQTPTMILKKIVLSDWIFRFDPCRSIPDNS